MTTRLFLNLLTLGAFVCAVGLVLVMVLHAPAVLAWAAILGFPALFVVLTVQLVTSQRPPVRQPSKPAIIQHEDGSIEVVLP